MRVDTFETPTMNDDFDKDLRELLAGLTEREKRVLRERFGIGIDPSLALRDVATRFAVTQERIRMIERRAIARVRGNGPPDGNGPDPPKTA